MHIYQFTITSIWRHCVFHGLGCRYLVSLLCRFSFFFLLNNNNNQPQNDLNDMLANKSLPTISRI